MSNKKSNFIANCLSKQAPYTAIQYIVYILYGTYLKDSDQLSNSHVYGTYMY